MAMPYTHFVPLIMGVGLGFMFDARMRKGPKVLPMLATVNAKGYVLCVVNWLTALVIFATGMLLIWSINVDPESWTQIQSSAFITFYRPLFCAAVVMLIWPVFFGYANAFKEGFGSTIFLVMSRLTYGVYLTYPLVITIVFASAPYSMSGYPLRVDTYTISNFFVPWLAAFICYILVEEPARKLNNLWFSNMKWANKKKFEID